MALTKERKIFLALGAAAGIALMGDRLFLGSTATGPNSAIAGTLTTPLPASAQPTPQNDGPRITDSTSILAQRLRDIAARENIVNDVHRDAFAPYETWLEQPMPDKPHNAGRAEPSKFRQNHSLEAVVPNLNRGYAMVDGAPLFVGQKVEGFTLVSVRNRSAVFEINGANIELRMDEDDMRQ